MIVVEKTGEATICEEIDIVGGYIIADMTFIPGKEIYEILWGEE